MKMGMLTLHNWRSVKDLGVRLQDMMIFIGQNNHGKSNILSSILFFFGQVGLDPLDFNADSSELFVEVTFGDLDEIDRTTFRKYVTADNTMRIRKQATKGDGFEYHGYGETPNIDWLREEKIGDYTSREIAATLPLANLLPQAGRISKEAFAQAQEKYIQEHKAEINFAYELETGPFMGAKNVAQGIFGELYFVPSVKRAIEELTPRGSSVFGGLYSRVITKMSETNAEFKDAKQRIIALMKILNRTTEDGKPNERRPPELTAFEQSLQKELDNWNTAVDVEITPPNVDDVLKVGTTVWVDDGIRTDISRKGQGLQRALIFALVKALAKVTREEAQTVEDSRQPDSTDQQRLSRKASRSAYFIMEEPELYLHPQAQREFYESLTQLSKAENQVILCTHSSSFLNLEDYKSICIVRKNSLEEGTTTFQCEEDLFAEADDKTNFNLTYWINPDRSELFFAKKVILVEGATDKTIIPYLANEIGVFRYDYTIIECGSKSAMPSYLLLLNRFSIPYIAVYDLDHQANKAPDALATADKTSARIEEVVDRSLGLTVLMINNIEEEIGMLGPSERIKPFLAISHVKSPSFVLTEQLDQKLRLIYR